MRVDELSFEEVVMEIEEERRESHIVVFLGSLIGASLIYISFILGLFLL